MTKSNKHYCHNINIYINNKNINNDNDINNTKSSS